MAETIIVNGVIHDWGSLVIRIRGKEYEGVLGIKYAQKRNRTKVRGQGRRRLPIGVTPGDYNAEDGSLTMTRQHAQMLRNDLAAASADGASYGDVLFPITVQSLEEGTSGIKDELIGCAIIGDDGGGEESSTDPLKEEIPFLIQEIRRNGKTLYKARRRR
jgi:hypothetical protein